MMSNSDLHLIFVMETRRAEVATGAQFAEPSVCTPNRLNSELVVASANRGTAWDWEAKTQSVATFHPSLALAASLLQKLNTSCNSRISAVFVAENFVSNCALERGL